MNPLASFRRRMLATTLGASLFVSAADPEAFAYADSAIQAPPGYAKRSHAGTTHTVTNCNDSGAGSLRDAIANAIYEDTIDLTPLTCSTITLTSGEISIPIDDITIRGPLDRVVTIDGGGSDRIIDHVGYRLSLYDLAFKNGFALNKGACVYSSGEVLAYASRFDSCTIDSDKADVRGGAIYALSNLSMIRSVVTASSASTSTGLASGGGVWASGKLTMRRSSIYGNGAYSPIASGGGGFYSHGAAIYDSTIDHNYAFAGGGGVMLGPYGDAELEIFDSTIANNSANVIGGIDVFGSGHFALHNSTIAFNCAQSQHYAGRPDIYGIGLRSDISQPTYLYSSIIADNGYCAVRDASPATTVYDVSLRQGSIVGSHNLIVTSTVPPPNDTIHADPMLTQLADHGGPTLTLGLVSGSPAIDAGYLPSLRRSYDQRYQGYARTVGAQTDIGAYEVQSVGAVHTVSTCNDNGAGSLRDTIGNAHSGDIIDLSGLSCGTITLGSALQIPVGNLTLIGPGASALTISAGSPDRVINHSGDGILRIQGVTIANGHYSASSAAFGGCLYSFSTVDISDSVFTGCQAIAPFAAGGAIYATRVQLARSTISNNGISGTTSARGGGVFAWRDISMEASTVTGNFAPSSDINPIGHGGGIYVHLDASINSSTVNDNQAAVGAGIYSRDEPNGIVSITNSTISGNTGLLGAGIAGAIGSIAASTIAFNYAAYPGGFVIPAGVLTTSRTQIQSNIFFGNLCNGAAYDIGGSGSLVGANNLVGTSPVLLPPDTIHGDPLLGPLQDNGGPTMTHALALASPAIDHGNNVSTLQYDQRGSGFPRIVGASADIGAFELNHDSIFGDGFE